MSKFNYNQKQYILSHFNGIKEVNADKEQYSSTCPVCGKENHLFIKFTDTVMIHCQKCSAPFDDIVECAGLTKKELYPEKPKSTKREIESRYHVYTDGNGNPVGKKDIKKYEIIDENGIITETKKNAFWSRYDRETGKYTNGLNGLKLPLYNLPALLNNETDTVYFVEGEKDVDTMTKLGFVATTLPHGANEKEWLSDYDAPIAGKKIVIIADNDEPGINYGNFIAKQILTRNLCSDVRIVNSKDIYAEIPLKGDISDIYSLLGKDKTIEKLLFSAKNTEPAAVDSLKNVGKANDIDRYGNNQRKGKNDSRVNHADVADEICNAHKVLKIENAFYIYDNGLYSPLESKIDEIVAREYPDKLSSFRKEVFRLIRDRNTAKESTVAPPYLIPFKSKIYDISADEFIDYTDENVFTLRFPYDYKPTIASDEPETFNSVFNVISTIADHDQAKTIRILEQIGYCFYTRNDYRPAIVIWYGNGNNGKSTLNNMIRQAVHPVNTVSLSLEQMSQKFKVSKLCGKAVNICNDIENGKLANSAVIKCIATNDTLVAEDKGKDPFEFQPICKVFLSTNSLPMISDTSDGFYSRLAIIELTHDFSKDGTQNIKFVHKVWSDTEMECFTAMALQAFMNVLKSGKFTPVESIDKAMTEMKRNNDHVFEWLSDYDEYKLLNNPRSDCYSDYEMWCTNNGHQKISSTAWTDKILHYRRQYVLKVNRYSNGTARGFALK